MPEELIDEVAAGQRIDWLKEYVGQGWIAEQLEARARRAAACGRWVPYDVHGHPLIDGIAIFDGEQEARGLAAALATPSGGFLLASASDVNHVVPNLTVDDAGRLASLVRRETARGYLYQCKIAAHHIRDGHGLRSFSLGEAVDGDVVVDAGAGDVEIQCKALAVGAGRRIPNRVFNTLATRVINEADRKRWRGKVVVECDVGLDDGDLSVLSDVIAEQFDGAAPSIAIPACYDLRVERREENVPEGDVDGVLQALRGADLRRPHIGILGNRFETGVRVLLVAKSRKFDKVIGKMVSTAVTATGQLGGALPGVVCVNTPERMNWRRVTEAGILDEHVSATFNTTDLSKAAAIVFTSEDAVDGAFVYRNPTAKIPLPEGFRLFGREPER